jgi:hypothetical protein
LRQHAVPRQVEEQEIITDRLVEESFDLLFELVRRSIDQLSNREATDRVVGENLR